MTLTQLEYFVETVQVRNFTKAAGNLFVSQPTLSRAIQNLEKELNVILIDREAKYKSGEISKENYDKWRYRFPEFDTTQILGKVPSKELSDALVEAFEDRLKD